MLRRLFKGRHPLTHPDAGVRRAAIRELDDTAAAGLTDELTRLVREDPDPEVRLACLVHVRDRALLESVLDDPLLGETAAQRLQALAPGSEPVQGMAAHAQLADLPAAEAAVRLRAISDVDELVNLVLETRGELRQLALDHPLLRRAPALTKLEKRSRGHDKSINRHARSRLDHYKRLLGDAEAHRSRAQELSAALGRHPPVQDRAWRERQHQLHARLEACIDEYRHLRDQLSELGESLADLEDLRNDPETLPLLEPAGDHGQPQNPGGTDGSPAGETAGGASRTGGEDPFEALVQGFRELDQALTAGRPFAELAAQRQALTDRWLTAADHQPPGETQHQVFEAVSHRFRELADAMERLDQAQVPALPGEPLEIGPPDDIAAHRALWEAVSERRGTLKRLEQIRRQVRWPRWAPPTAEYAALLDAAEDLREQLGRADTVLNDELTRLEELISSLSVAIDEGSFNHAQGLLTRARALHDALPAPAVRSAGKGLGKQAARLAELKDWQTFATSPKRESLVQSMAALAADPLEPRSQADRIKALRREWQALGPITQAADGRLADRFNAEAEKAFEPCRAYFAQQAEQRKANLEERRRICDQLERYLEDTDWSDADMKAAERIMRAARDEWRRFHPVDRNPGKSVEARFERLQDRLHDLVKAEWERNLKAKEDIVAEAEALTAAELAIQEKVAAAKRLQRRWREVGITPRRPDQRLWRAFRAACDDVFSARDQSRDAADAALSELETRMTARLETFEAELTDRDPRSASEAELKTFRQETADVDRLPQDRRRSLAERRSRLVARYNGLLDEQRRSSRREALAELARWDACAAAAEIVRGQGGDAPIPDAPAGAEHLREARLACEGGDVPREAARRLAVKAELAAGRESPPEDEPLRLEIQVERLQAGLSGTARAEDPQALAEDWCRLGPKDDELAPLRDRLFAALDAML